MPCTEAGRLFTPQDCIPGSAPEGQVIAVGDGLDEPQQLFYCPGQQDAATPAALLAVSLEDGQYCRIQRGAVLGAVKPELVPEKARLHLSQVRPLTARQPNGAPWCSAYCFLPDGRYTSAVHFADIQGAMGYVEIQKDYQARIMLCDSTDCCIFEMVDGQVVFPSREMLGQYAENTGGIGMIQ